MIRFIILSGLREKTSNKSYLFNKNFFHAACLKSATFKHPENGKMRNCVNSGSLRLNNCTSRGAGSPGLTNLKLKPTWRITADIMNLIQGGRNWNPLKNWGRSCQHHFKNSYYFSNLKLIPTNTESLIIVIVHLFRMLHYAW